MSESDPKMTKMSYSLWPSPNISTSVVEYYNSVFAMHPTLVEYVNYCIMFDNQKLYKICDERLGLHSPRYEDVNKIIASHLSSLFASMRFGG